MGSEISSVVIEPLLGASIITLAIFSIIKENQKEQTSAKWFAVGATSLTLILIIVNILMGILV